MRVHPALQGSPEGHDLAPAILSRREDLVAPYNDGEFVNHKRRLCESQQVGHQTEFTTIDPQSPDLDVDRDYLRKRTTLAD